MVSRMLVISSYPGSMSSNLWYSLVDEFKRHVIGDSEVGLRLGSAVKERVQNESFGELAKKFVEERAIKCSFFAVWGSRTHDGKLYSMRNLDWTTKVGLNKHKLITVYKIDNTIPHATIGFPGVIGALTGMSGEGLTVHEAGLNSKREEVEGLQWTLRLRHVMMHASNLSQAIQLWNQTSNTFGLNHMIASAKDVMGGHAAVVLENDGRSTRYFFDHDKREDGTQFYDPTTKTNFTAGFSMPEAIFRTNHAYD